MRFILLVLSLSCCLFLGSDAALTPFEITAVTDADISAFFAEFPSNSFAGSTVKSGAHEKYELLRNRICAGDPTKWTEEAISERYRLLQDMAKGSDARNEEGHLDRMIEKWLIASKNDKEFMDRVTFTTTVQMNFGKALRQDSDTPKFKNMTNGTVYPGIGNRYVAAINGYCTEQKAPSSKPLILCKVLIAMGLKAPALLKMQKEGK